MKLRFIGIAAVIALIAVTAAMGATAGRDFAAPTLTGMAETPKGDPDGSGTAEVKVNGKSTPTQRRERGGRPRRPGRSSRTSANAARSRRSIGRRMPPRPLDGCRAPRRRLAF